MPGHSFILATGYWLGAFFAHLVKWHGDVRRGKIVYYNTSASHLIRFTKSQE